jgi:predicted N-formylglutamate amidohydrolase
LQRAPAFLVTCEHGGNRIPAAYRALFRGRRELLESHRGYDAGALTLARLLARRLAAPLEFSTISRLVVDLNRSIGHPHLYSEMTRATAPGCRAGMLEAFYRPYRLRVESLVARFVQRGQRAVHVSAHSFTPRLAGVVRTADVGFLYDPARPQEAALCAHWQAALRSRMPALRVRRNYPYRGNGDGLTAHLRRLWPANRYVGIEIEINQAIVHRGGAGWAALRRTLADVLAGIPPA